MGTPLRGEQDLVLTLDELATRCHIVAGKATTGLRHQHRAWVPFLQGAAERANLFDCADTASCQHLAAGVLTQLSSKDG